MAATRDIHKHMLEQMAELELKKKEYKQIDEDMLKQRIIQDQKVIITQANFTFELIKVKHGCTLFTVP